MILKDCQKGNKILIFLLKEINFIEKIRIIMKKIQSFFWELLAPYPYSKTSKWVHFFIYFLIVVSLAMLVIESYKDLDIQYATNFFYFDMLILVVFSIEYIGNLIIAPLVYKEKNSLLSIKKYTTSFDGIVDLLAILPFYLPILFPFPLYWIRVIRLTRLFRLLTFGKYDQVIGFFKRAFYSIKDGLILSLILAVIVTFIASVLIYTVENPVQPLIFSDIPRTMWWAFMSITKGGYEDWEPITLLGKIFFSLLSLSGILLTAIPTALLLHGFIDQVEEDSKEGKEEEK